MFVMSHTIRSAPWQRPAESETQQHIQNNKNENDIIHTMGCGSALHGRFQHNA